MIVGQRRAFSRTGRRCGDDARRRERDSGILVLALLRLGEYEQQICRGGGENHKSDSLLPLSPVSPAFGFCTPSAPLSYRMICQIILARLTTL